MSEMTPEKLREVPGTRTVPSSVLDAFASAWEADLRDQDILKAHHDLHHKDDEASRARIEALEKADETAWGIIANATDWDDPDDGSPCGNMAKKWREAAIGWRDERHKRLAAFAAKEET